MLPPNPRDCIEYVPFDVFTRMIEASAIAPMTTLDRVLDISLDIHRADCRIVDGSVPTACPKADPPIPREYLPCVVAIFDRLKLLPPGKTIHWIGFKAWRANRCDCERNGSGERTAAISSSETNQSPETNNIEGDGVQKRGRGRARQTDWRRDSEIVAAWHSARDSGVPQKDFAKDRGITLRELKKLLNRHAKRSKQARTK